MKRLLFLILLFPLVGFAQFNGEGIFFGDSASFSNGATFGGNVVAAGFIQDVNGNVSANNTVVINDTADFPDLVNGKYPLADSTSYYIGADITTSYPILLGSGSCIYSYCNKCGFIRYNGTDTLFHSFDSDVKFFDIGIIVPNGTVFNLNDTTETKRLNINQLFLPSCNDIGYFNGFLQTGFQDNCFPNLARGFQINNGKCTDISRNKGSLLTDTLIHIIDGDFFGIAFNGNEAYIFPGSVAIHIADSVTALGGEVAGNNFFGGGTYLSGINQNDNDYGWEVVSNNNINDFGEYVSIFDTANVATFSATSQTAVKITGLSTNMGDSSRFSHTSPNRVDYLGKQSDVFYINFEGSFGTTGSNHNATLIIYKNGSPVDGGYNRGDVDRNDYVPLSVQAVTTIDEGDYIEVYYRNESGVGAINVACTSYNLVIFRL